MRSLLAIISIVFCLQSAHAQNQERIRWMIRASVGNTYPITDFAGGHFTDGLIGYSQNTLKVDILSTSYFFENWGVELKFTLNHNRKLSDRKWDFRNDVSNRFSDLYFSDAWFMPSVGSEFGKSTIGPIYKWHIGNHLMIARGLFGFVSVDLDTASTDLKGIGTNDRYIVSWRSDRAGKDFFTLNPSCTFGLKLLKRLYLDVDLDYWIYRIKLNYTETILNLDSLEKQSQIFKYNSLIHEWSLGLGLMYVLR